MLRIIAGQVRGRRLRTPKGWATRPTSDRVREALFNILGQRVLDSMFLDLFAGSGAVGLEALSRGARKVIFVENNCKALASLLFNLSATGFQDKGQVIATDARRALFDLNRQGLTFDLAYIDPPYYQDWGRIILPAVVSLLLPEGLTVLETATSEAGPEIDGLVMVSRRAYGDTALNIYQMPGGLAGGDYNTDRRNGENG